jgi:prepilin-type N-terminal cleavage/methylation domain-containing protein
VFEEAHLLNPDTSGRRGARLQHGFSMLELMASLTVLLIVIAIVMSGLTQMVYVRESIDNRTEMHASVRGATELMQQEIGQAGRISLPAAVTVSAAVAAGTQTASLSSSSGMFVGEYLDFDTGANYETVQITAVGTNTVTGSFVFAHASGVQVMVSGSFGTGIVPPAASPTSYTNGSTGSVLKLYGDINRDGKILYVEYTCSTGTAAAPGFLYRNQMSFTTSPKPAVSAGKVLLDNLLANPDGSACFIYQTAAGKTGNVYVTDVAVTLTVQTEQVDPQTRLFQQETKALLNISPRNIYEAWELDNASSTQRIQPMPATVTALLP